jgi:hypothetical protein
MSLTQMVNDRLLALVDLRVTRASNWRQQNEDKRRLELLSASGVAQARILKVASLLVPQNAIGQSKVRLGNKHDGGYICLEDFDGVTAAFSFGIGQNVDWDLEIAEKGIVVYQFDHTVDRPPARHAKFCFHKKKIVPIRTPASNEETVSQLLATNTSGDVATVILKIDIEHDEWQVFSKLTSHDLVQFSQIICEFHAFSAILDDEWYGRTLNVLTKLNRHFAVVHVHGNNFLPWMDLGGVPFPELLEVTYASRNRYEFEPSKEIFPTLLDAPNDPSKPDLFLGRFVFQHA